MRIVKNKVVIMAVSLIVAASCQAAMVWTGDSDGLSAYDEGNWLDNDGLVPAPDTVNGGVAITAATGGLIEINAGVGSPSYSGHFVTGEGVALAVGNGKELTAGGGYGIKQTTDGGVANTDFEISGASTVSAKYIADFDITMDGGSTLTLGGGGDPLPGATIDLLDLNSVIQFNAETEAAFVSEHLSKCTVNGAPMELGVNATASAFNGAKGVQIQASVPPEAAPTIAEFTISNSNVLPGGMATLSWDVLQADSVVIDQGVGDVTATNEVDVTVNADTLYTLIATNAYGASTGTVSVTLITTVPQINSFTAGAGIANAGETVLLEWDADDAVTFSLDQGIGDVTGLTSKEIVFSENITYMLTAGNPNGSSTQTVTIVQDIHNGLFVHYPFDVDGTAAVGADATLGVAASISSDAAYGSGSLALSGTPVPDTFGNDGAVSGDLFSLGTGARTVAFWMKAAAGDTGDTNSTMISLGDRSSSGSRYDVRLDGDNLRLEIRGNGFSTTSAVADGTWHHIAVVAPADATLSDVMYYIDGAYVTNMTGGLAINTGVGPLRVGDSFEPTGAGRDYKGLLDDVRLYRRVLSASEVAALVTDGPGLPAENLQISVPGSGEIVVLSWTGENGKPYGVETNSNLVIGDWQPFRTGLIGDGMMSSVTNSIGPDQTFYRVISE